MIRKLDNMWLNFLLRSGIKKIDFRIEGPRLSDITYEYCDPTAICIVVNYKWFWEKSTPSECCDQ